MCKTERRFRSFFCGNAVFCADGIEKDFDSALQNKKFLAETCAFSLTNVI